MNSTLKGHDANWAQIRHLVMRLLEQHEDTIEDLLEIVKGSDDTGGLITRVCLLEEQVKQARIQMGLADKEVAKISLKSDSAHKKINGHLQDVVMPKDEWGKKKIMQIAAGILGILTVLSTALGKLVEYVLQQVGSGGTP